MQKLSRSLFNQPVLSLHSGAQIAVALEPIINPNNLKIIGWRCKADGVEAILLTEDVRESTPQGLAVNDDSALASPADLVRYQEIIDMKFQLIGKLVKSPKHKIGKVVDFAYDDSTIIQSIYVDPPLVKLFGSHETRIIGRKQIKEVTDSFILVDDAEVEAEQPAVAKEVVETESPAIPETA